MGIVTMIAIIFMVPVLPMFIASFIVWDYCENKKMGQGLLFTAIAFFFVALILFLLPCLEVWPC